MELEMGLGGGVYFLISFSIQWFWLNIVAFRYVISAFAEIVHVWKCDSLLHLACRIVQRGDCWCNIKVIGATWRSLVQHGGHWCNVEYVGATWRSLVQAGGHWCNLEVVGAMWRSLLQQSFHVLHTAVCTWISDLWPMDHHFWLLTRGSWQTACMLLQHWCQLFTED